MKSAINSKMEAQSAAATQPMDTKTEADVGAVAFTTTSPAIACVFRERYSDFVVREVALGGAEVKLESEALPAAADAPAAAAAAEAASAAGLVALCGGDAVDRLRATLAKPSGRPRRGSFSFGLDALRASGSSLAAAPRPPELPTIHSAGRDRRFTEDEDPPVVGSLGFSDDGAPR